jgi:hypothetical protein
MIACAAFVGACGDSTVPNTPLTDAQVDELMAAMSNIGFVPAAGSLAAMRAPAAARGTANAISLNVDENVDCPVSGSIHVTGTFSFNDINATAFTMNVKEKHQACAATSEQTGKTWTFNGKPDVTVNLTANVTNLDTGAGTLTGTEKGAIAFATDGLEGTCQIDLNINATTNDVGVTTGSVTGTVCGKQVNEQFTDPAA